MWCHGGNTHRPHRLEIFCSQSGHTNRHHLRYAWILPFSATTLVVSKPLVPVFHTQNIGLYSSFVGLEESLWLLWQLAITGESFLILSPHARTCSQAALAFTRFGSLLTNHIDQRTLINAHLFAASLIAPLQFHGDCRPYFTVYEADFDVSSLSKLTKNNLLCRMLTNCVDLTICRHSQAAKTMELATRKT